MDDIKLGALCWNQYTDWPSLLEAGVRADRLGYDTLWTWDHLYPIVGSPEGPIFEGWLTLAAWAQATGRVRIGLMVGANTFREPTLTAKMATTLDHISGGRAILGIGACLVRDRAHWPTASVRRRAAGTAALAGRGAPGHARHAPRRASRRHPVRATRRRSIRNDPLPVQERLPLLIGGGGEQVTLKLVARYGDANNVGGGIDNVKRKEAVLLRHCETVGRDPTEIERTTGLGTIIIRDSRAEASRVRRAIFERNGGAVASTDELVGTPEDIAEAVAPFLEIGYRHILADFAAPYDEETMTRFATEVRALLERA